MLVRKNLLDLATFARTGTATFLDADRLVKTAAVNVPRFQHNAAGARLGLLSEEDKTNLLPEARDLTGSPWNTSNAGGTVTLTATGIDGAANVATRWIEDTGDGGTGRRIVDSASFTSGTQYCASIVVGRAAGTRHFQWLLASGAFGVNVIASYNLDTGVVTIHSAGTATAAGMEPLPDGRWLCWITSQATATASASVQPRMSADPTSAAGVVYTGDGTSGLILDGVQVETGFRPTSRIFTSGSTVTRARDECSVTDLSWLGSGAGTVVFRGVVNRGAACNAWRLRVDSNNFIGINVGSTGGLQLQQFRAGSTDGFLNFGDITFGVPFAVSVAWGGGAFSGSFNGASVITNSYSDLIDPTGGTLWIGSRQADLGQINGTIGLLSHYPSKLPDADLQALTA